MKYYNMSDLFESTKRKLTSQELIDTIKKQERKIQNLKDENHKITEYISTKEDSFQSEIDKLHKIIFDLKTCLENENGQRKLLEDALIKVCDDNNLKTNGVIKKMKNNRVDNKFK